MWARENANIKSYFSSYRMVFELRTFDDAITVRAVGIAVDAVAATYFIVIVATMLFHSYSIRFSTFFVVIFIFFFILFSVSLSFCLSCTYYLLRFFFSCYFMFFSFLFFLQASVRRQWTVLYCRLRFGIDKNARLYYAHIWLYLCMRLRDWHWRNWKIKREKKAAHKPEIGMCSPIQLWNW